MNGSPTVELYFEDVKVPKENVLVKSITDLQWLWDYWPAAITIGAQGLGIGEGA